MASSGTITLSTQSVDYPCCPYGRGHITLTNVIGWSVDNNGDISFWSISSSDNVHGTWGLCWASAPYYLYMQPQVSYDNGSSWQSLDYVDKYVNTVCTNPPTVQTYTNAVSTSIELIGNLGTYHLTGNCLLRFVYASTSAPMPGEANQNAFPDSGYSEATQVPVQVEVDWVATVKYDATGGSGAPGNQTRTVNASATSTSFTVSNTIPTKTNHRFDGWIYGGTIYHGGDTITVQKSTPTITLKAVWTEFYRPGATLYSADEYFVESPVWYSNHKTNGACHIRTESDTWKEMRTIDGATNGQGDPPLIYRNDSLYNQKKLGKTS